MPAANTDLFKKLTNNFSTTLSGAIVGAGDTSMSLASTTNLPTDTGIVLVVDRVNASGVVTPTVREYIKGTVSGSTIINLVRGVGNSTAQAHLSGAIVEQVVDQTTINDIVSGIITHANQDGTLKTSAVQTALGQGGATGAGWTTIGNTPNTITDNGNRSYTCVYNAVDLTSTFSVGMRLQHTRTVTAPTKSTSLNGTTQYWNNTTPGGMTFTNNFVVSAWIKLTSYPIQATIASRYNGTSGWSLRLNTSGQINLAGFNGGSSNFKITQSYQSVPLNKWVHVAAQLDMTSSTMSPTVNYAMIDGVDVPASQVTSGTNPTALIQAGNLEIGSENAGLLPFPGKIAQVAIYSAKVTEATIAASRNQPLVGTETSLISAYSFNSNANDLNANANNLTAQNGSTALNADTPFTQTPNLTGVTPGTTNYGIVTSVSFSTNTTVVVQVPEGDTLPVTGAISAVSYSTQKVPYGFPADNGKWRIETILKTTQTQVGATQGTWYNLNAQLNIPISAWRTGYDAPISTSGSTTSLDVNVTFSSTNNSASDSTFSTYLQMNAGSAGLAIEGVVHKDKPLTLTAQATYYLNIAIINNGTNTIALTGAKQPAIIFAECAYL